MFNPNRIPVFTLDDLDSLDKDEIIEGYCDGFINELCGDNRSRSFWHGWRNGMMDAGFMEMDEASRSLAHEYYMKWMKK